MPTVERSPARLLTIAVLTLAGAVLLPLAGVLPWAWARECGGFGLRLGFAFLAPTVTCIGVLDWSIPRGRLTLARALLVTLLTLGGLAADAYARAAPAKWP